MAAQTPAPSSAVPPAAAPAAPLSAEVTPWTRSAPSADYLPLTTHQKFEVFVKRTYAPATFIGAAFDAGISQATSGHEEYGQGMQGYGKRYGASLADGETGVFFGYYLLPTLFHQDPRYFRRPELPAFRRTLYAMSRLILTRTDSGANAVNVSYLGGSLISSSITNSYYPFDERGAGDTFLRVASGMLSDAGMNVFHEFWPDLKARLSRNRTFHRLENTSVGKKVEEKVEQINH